MKAKQLKSKIFVFISLMGLFMFSYLLVFFLDTDKVTMKEIIQVNINFFRSYAQT